MIRGSIFALMISASSVMAHDIPCGPTDGILEQLSENYGESPIGIGKVNEVVVAQLWVSQDGKTWTMVTIGADGFSCLQGNGENWETFEFIEPKKGELN